MLRHYLKITLKVVVTAGKNSLIVSSLYLTNLHVENMKLEQILKALI